MPRFETFRSTAQKEFLADQSVPFGKIPIWRVNSAYFTSFLPSNDSNCFMFRHVMGQTIILLLHITKPSACSRYFAEGLAAPNYTRRFIHLQCGPGLVSTSPEQRSRHANTVCAAQPDHHFFSVSQPGHLTAVSHSLAMLQVSQILTVTSHPLTVRLRGPGLPPNDTGMGHGPFSPTRLTSNLSLSSPFQRLARGSTIGPL